MASKRATSRRRRSSRAVRTVLYLIFLAVFVAIGFFGWPVASRWISSLPFFASASEPAAAPSSSQVVPIEDTNQISVPGKPIKPDAGVLLENNAIFEQLSEDDKNVIRNIKAGMMECEEEVFLSEPASQEQVNLAMHVLNEQDIELIHFSGSDGWTYMLNPDGKVTSIRFSYTMTKDELDTALAQMQEAANSAIAQTSMMSPYEKSVFFNDWLVDEVVYDLEAPNAHSAYGALVEKRAVCDGYALAKSLLMNQTQVPTIVMHGFSMSDPHEVAKASFEDVTLSYDENGLPVAPEGMGGHAWTASLLEDGWYYSDTTFNDAEDGSVLGRHRYLNLPFDEINRSRVFAPYKLTAEYYPKENHSTYKWTAVENRIASTKEEAQAIFLHSLQSRDPDIVIEISDPALYAQLKESRQMICVEWASQAGLADVVDWNNGVVSCEDGLQILEFVLPYTQ